MSKAIKKLVFIIAIILLCGIIQLIAPQKANAISINENTIIHGYAGSQTNKNYNKTIKELKEGKSIIFAGAYILRTPYIFCYHEGQKLNSTINESEYWIKTKIEIRNGSVTKTTGENSTTSTNTAIVQYGNGLAYILSKTNINLSYPSGGYSGGADMWRRNEDNVQRALWYYLSQATGNVKTFFEIPTQNPISDMDNDYYKQAIANTKNNSATIYILTNNKSQQELLLVENAEESPVQPISFNLYKRERGTNNPINGVDINTEITTTNKICPSCGATNNVSSLGENKCEYCGTILN